MMLCRRAVRKPNVPQHAHQPPSIGIVTPVTALD
jgi:hypothetical protein